MKDIVIGNKVVGKSQSPFIIAEMSGNHNQSIQRGKEIIDGAAFAGAHAIKLQTYTADTMTVRGAVQINAPDTPWHGRELYDLYQEAYTPWEWHEELFQYAKGKGLVAFSTPFDISSVEFLEELNVPAYKIASFENTDIPLLKRVAQTKKPVIMSTGAITLAQLSESVEALRDNGCEDLVLLKCTSSYPSTPESSNIATIPHLAESFGCHSGLSDHTLGIGCAVASVALGATVIEKHLTLDRGEGGVDSAFSLEPHELKMLVEETHNAALGIGEVQYGIQSIEKDLSFFKRSIYVVSEIKEGEKFTSENIRVIRPGNGLMPKHLELVLGKTAKKSIQEGTPLSFDHIL